MVNFKLVSEMEKAKWVTWHERGTKEKIWVSDRDPWSTEYQAGALSTGRRGIHGERGD